MQVAPAPALPRARIAVLGLGGVGGVIAARTGAVGVATARTAAAVQARGLVVSDPAGTTTNLIEVVEVLEQPVELLIVAVKAHMLDAALERVSTVSVDEDTLVLPLLNGLEQVERIRVAFTRGGAGQSARLVAAGSIGGFEAHVLEPGVIVQRSAGGVIRAASDALGPRALGARLAPLRAPGLELEVVEGERAVLWEKVARLAVLAPATVASGAPVGALRDDPRWAARLRAGIEEAVRVAESEGILLDPAAQWAMIQAMAPDLTTSAARDAAAGRASELDAITGAVVRAARSAGVATPTLDGLLEEAEAACRARSR